MSVDHDRGEVYRKRVFVRDLTVGTSVDEVFCIARVDRLKGRKGPYLRLELTDRTGSVPGVAWDDVDALSRVLVSGAFARIRGDVNEYRDALQVRVDTAQVASRVEPEEYLPRGPVPVEQSLDEIRELVSTIGDVWLRGLVEGFLADPDAVARFVAAPAAKVVHHAYVGGLAEHTLSVMTLCAHAADHYPGVDRDLLLVAAFFHDIGKIEELAVEPGFPYTERGSLIGHVVLGHALVRELISRTPGFPEERATDLEHLVLSHQGELEWGSPVKPQTIEGLVLHFIDNLDSKVTAARGHLDVAGAERTGYIRTLGRSLFRRVD